jgi:hypothetical protein
LSPVAQAVRSRDVETAQRIVAAYVLSEWQASESAPRAMEAMAQAIADAMQAGKRRDGPIIYRLACTLTASLPSAPRC